MSSRSQLLTALAVALAAVAYSTWLRIHTAFAVGCFDGDAEGLLRADPGTLWYLLQRVIEGGGWPAASFAADPRIEHPTLTDCWAEFTVGHEFLLAGLHALWPDVPLHRLCVIALAAVTSLTGLGVFATVQTLTRAPLWSATAAVLFALTPAAYRTIGFVLMNEDLSLPLWAAHLWLTARALRAGRARDAAAAGLAAVAAAATWHATTFLLTLGFATALAFTLATGRALLPRRAALTLLVTLVLGGIAVPVLRAKGFALGLPVQLLLATLAASSPNAWSRILRAAATLGAAGLAAFGLRLATGREGDLGHVLALFWAKLGHLGQFPDDPTQLSFDARIMWQGPFASTSIADLLLLLGALLPLAVCLFGRELAGWRRASDAPALPRLLGVALGASLVLTLLVNRLQVVPAILGPIAVGAWLATLRPRVGAAVALTVLAAQPLVCARFFAQHTTWHDPVQVQEMRAALEAVRDFTPRDAAIAADPVSSGAILAHTGRRVAVQAKWESRESRRRMQVLLTPFHLGTVADVHRMLRDELRCDYFLVDRRVLWGLCRQMSGIPRSQQLPAPGTAAAAFCTDDLNELRALPGFELLYRSPSWIRHPDGSPSGYVRMFRVLP